MNENLVSLTSFLHPQHRTIRAASTRHLRSSNRANNFVNEQRLLHAQADSGFSNDDAVVPSDTSAPNRGLNIIDNAAHAQSATTYKTDTTHLAQSVAANNPDTDSELSEFEIADIGLTESQIHTLDTTSYPIKSESVTVESDHMNINNTTYGKATGGESDESDLSTLVSDDEDSRPPKRVKIRGSKYGSATSASAPAINLRSTSQETNKPLATPSLSFLAVVGTARTALSQNIDTTTHSSLSSILPRSLPLGNNNVIETSPVASNLPENHSLRMVILPKSEVETLKLNNGILRSHNLSLARQNANLRHENAQVILLHQEIKDMEPVDHTGCVSKEDYQKVQAENQKLQNEMAKLRYEHQLMKECAMEWASRENLWEVEQQLLKNEVVDLVARVNELVRDQQEMMIRLRDQGLQLQQAEYRADQESARAMEVQEQLGHAVAIVKNLKERGSVYPAFEFEDVQHDLKENGVVVSIEVFDDE